jgi:hypothetical protein
MGVPDWVLIGTALFLGLTALIVPWLSEVVKRKAFAPSLKISFELKPPFCHKTYWGSPKNPVYFCRFLVENTGKSQARLCEVVLEDLWICDASGRSIKIDNFSPVNLKWAGHDPPQFLDINPGRKFFCAIGYISSPSYQYLFEKKNMVNIPGKESIDIPRFVLDQREIFYAQPNCFVPGKYAIRVTIFSENASEKEIYFEISWSGNWQDTEPEFFRELVISPSKKI